MSGNLAPQDIARVVAACAQESADAIAQCVVDEARAANRVADDITVVVLRLGSGESVAVPELRRGPYCSVLPAAAGDRVQVVQGPLAGRTGAVVKVRADQKPVVRLDGAEKLLVISPERIEVLLD